MDLNSEIKPMSHTRGRGITFCGGGDRGWGARIEARLEASHEANKVLRDHFQECASVSVHELIRKIALTPLNTLLGK
jgi:hypothetical protein